MKQRVSACAGLLLAMVSIGAWAISPLTEIDQIYSNADGTVQFIVAIDRGMTDCDSGEAAWAGQPLVSSGALPTKKFVFLSNLPTCRTSGKRILIATTGFAALGLVTPDFVIPNNFLQQPSGQIAIGNVTSLIYSRLPDDGVHALDGFDRTVQNLATNLAGASTSVATLPAVELNQHGLTGFWFNPETSGQGNGIEVFADSSSGTGLVFVSWYTYDTVAGGAERQRWYTAAGPVVTGQPIANLMIYQNTGGNFDAPPVTSAQVVGTATLAFNSCVTGTFAYDFSDGSGRRGTIPLTRLLQNATCSLSAPYSSNPDFALSGNWYSAATSGQGFTIETNIGHGVLFAAWYTYAPTGATAGAAGQRWYAIQAPFSSGMRSLSVTIFEPTGGVFDSPQQGNIAAVGTATLAFETCTTATFTYIFTGGSSSGRSGTIALTRVGPAPPGC